MYSSKKSRYKKGYYTWKSKQAISSRTAELHRENLFRKQKIPLLIINVWVEVVTQLGEGLPSLQKTQD